MPENSHQIEGDDNAITDLVVHLRTIHFATVVVSTALLVGAMNIDTWAAGHAVRDIQDVFGALAVLRDTSWLDRSLEGNPRGKTGVSSRDSHKAAWLFRIPDVRVHSRTTSGGDSAVVVLADDAVRRLSVASSNVAAESPSKDMNTLQEWRSFWDFLPDTVWLATRRF